MRTLLILAVAAILVAPALAPERLSPEDEAIARAARFLWAAQSPDGGWKSAHHALLRPGQALTPFELEALLRVPAEVCAPPPGAVERAVAFIERHVDAEGALGRAVPPYDEYPCYATALAVRALVRANRAPATVMRMVAWLRAQQIGPAGGFTPDHPAFGAWGLGGAPRTAPHAGHVDASMTRYALEALAAVGARPGDPALERAASFFERLRAADGGAFHSTIDFENKADLDPFGRPRSYGSATADAVLAWRAMGVAGADPRLVGALRWLAERHDARTVPPFDARDGDAGWGKALQLYYLAAVAEVFAGAPDRAPRGWQAGVRAAIAALQRPDGSVAGAGGRQKEDDPLLGTALALRALIAARAADSAGPLAAGVRWRRHGPCFGALPRENVGREP